MVVTLSEGAQRAILSLVDAGGSLEDVERRIERMGPLDDEDRAVLWLLAWSHQDGAAVSGESGIELVRE